MQERHNDIQRIEQTITELAALFQEMSILVEQQDEQLNVIKDHAQHTEQEVQAAYVHSTHRQASADGQGGHFGQEAPQDALDLLLDPGYVAIRVLTQSC